MRALRYCCLRANRKAKRVRSSLQLKLKIATRSVKRELTWRSIIIAVAFAVVLVGVLDVLEPKTPRAIVLNGPLRLEPLAVDLAASTSELTFTDSGGAQTRIVGTLEGLVDLSETQIDVSDFGISITISEGRVSTWKWFAVAAPLLAAFAEAIANGLEKGNRQKEVPGLLQTELSKVPATHSKRHKLESAVSVAIAQLDAGVHQWHHIRMLYSQLRHAR